VKKRHSTILVFGLPIVLALTAYLAFLRQEKEDQKIVSEFGKYQGYSKKLFDGYKRASDFLTLSDGTRLAYDVYLPTKDGIPVDKPLPALFHYPPYGRRWTIFNKDGEFVLNKLMDLPWYMELAVRFRYRFLTNGNQMDKVFLVEWLKPMLMHGYIVVVVDRPGTGASFRKLDHSPAVQARQVDEVLNWIAEQSWCDGNIGMYRTQQMLKSNFSLPAGTIPKAILPPRPDGQLLQRYVPRWDWTRL
jgi:predicted acyl esterase